jgi:prepilin-type N-terminal cleavage/methylation domain-containing protein
VYIKGEYVKMRNKKGFTLVELVIVIVIVGILSVVAVPIYRGYTRKAMASEGKALLGAINTSERVYYAEFGDFLAVSTTNYNSQLDVDARGNKYFTGFSTTVSNTSDGSEAFTAVTTGAEGAEGITLTLTASVTVPASIQEEGI